MNILFVCDEYPPVKGGGIGSVTKIVAESLAKEGHSVYVYGCMLPTCTQPEKSHVNGVTIYRKVIYKKFTTLFEAKNTFSRFAMSLMLRLHFFAYQARRELSLYFNDINKIIQENNIDLVEFPDFLTLSEYCQGRVRITVPKLNVPTIIRVHGSLSFLEYHKKGRINKITKENDLSLFNIGSNILAVSNFSKRFIETVLSIRKNIDVIYNPIDISNRNCEKSAIANEVPTIVYVGKITESKGAFNLIKAFNLFSIEQPKYRLIMIGGGLIQKAKELLNTTIKERVTFTGFISRNEIMNYINNADFCVIPSWFENFSLAALETMSCQKALIYTETASGKELIEDEVDGILVNPYEPVEIYKKMMLLATNSDLRATIAEKARTKIIHKFSTEVITKSLLEYYHNAIDSF